MKRILLFGGIFPLLLSCTSVGYRDAHLQRNSLYVPKASIEESLKDPEELNTFLSLTAFE